MLKTLHGYLSRDLARVLILALIVLTLIMSVFSIIEPLRKQGLRAQQALGLFVLTVPVMVSLTLPVAALFAATMIYGRFSRDNELLACKASGISALTVLRPGLAMGVLVTVVTLALSNFVSPMLARLSQAQLEANVRGLLVHELKTRGYFRHETYVLYADDARVTEEGGLFMQGVVLVDIGDAQDRMVMAAERALVRTRTHGDNTYVTLRAWEGGGHIGSPESSREQRITHLGEQQLPPMPGFGEEDVAFYDWFRLLEVYRKPHTHPEIRRKMFAISREIRQSHVLQDIASTLNAGLPYTKLTHRDQPIVLEADGAAWGQDGTIVLRGRGAQAIRVRVLEAGRTVRTYRATRGSVAADWTPVEDVSFLTIRLSENVTLRGPGLTTGAVRREGVELGSIPLPADVVSQTDFTDPQVVAKVLSEPRSYTRDPKVIERLKMLRDHRVPRGRREIVGEMHGRIAYGVSCFLMVAFGAALGMIFRGGQMISAFALSVIPAATVIIVIIMGQQLLSQQNIPVFVGVGAIWGGIVALTVANVVAYWRLARR